MKKNTGCLYKLILKNTHTSSKPAHPQPNEQIPAKSTIDPTHFLNKTKSKQTAKAIIISLEKRITFKDKNCEISWSPNIK